METFLLKGLELAGSAAGVFLFTAAAKRISFIPISEGQTLRIRTLAGVLSAVASVVLAVADGKLDGPVLQSSFIVVVQAASILWAAHCAHKLSKPPEV